MSSLLWTSLFFILLVGILIFTRSRNSWQPRYSWISGNVSYRDSFARLWQLLKGKVHIDCALGGGKPYWQTGVDPGYKVVWRTQRSDSLELLWFCQAALGWSYPALEVQLQTGDCFLQLGSDSGMCNVRKAACWLLSILIHLLLHSASWCSRLGTLVVDK